MDIRSLMSSATVTPDVQIEVFDLFHAKLIYSGLYDESPECVGSVEVDSFEVSRLAEHGNQFYIDQMTITADLIL